MNDVFRLSVFIIIGLKGMYLAMARVAHREGYPEIGLYWEKAAYEEAEHAAKFAELLGEVITDSTKKNLEMRVDAENGATAGKFELAKLAKQYNLDAIHDTTRAIARYMPTSEHSPSKFARRPLMISSRTLSGTSAPKLLPTPTICSAAQDFSSDCLMNLLPGTLQMGHFSGGVSPS